MTRDAEVADAGPDHGLAVGPALVLTVEELTVLEQAHLRGLEAVPGDPLLSADNPDVSADNPDALADSPDVHDVGLLQARWSLIGRGLLSPQGLVPEDTDLGLLLQTLLDVRVAAEALVVVERLLGEGRRDLRLLHLVPQGGVVEDVHPDGLHGLDLVLTDAGLVTAVTQMVVPADAQAGRGEEVTVEMSDFAALPDLLQRPTVLAELTMLRPEGEETGHLVALGPRGCWAGPRLSGQGRLRLSPVEPDWVGELVSTWVGDVALGTAGASPGSAGAFPGSAGALPGSAGVLPDSAGVVPDQEGGTMAP